MRRRTFRWIVAGVVFAATAAVVGTLARRRQAYDEATDDVALTVPATGGVPDADTSHPAAV